MTDSRKLTYFVAASIDGFIAGSDGGDPTGPDGFWPVTDDYIEFLVREFPETLPAGARAALGVTEPGSRFDTVLEGRRTYEVGLAAGVANAYPHLRHLVFSTTRDALHDPAIELVHHDPIARVRELKCESGRGLWLVGGGTLAAALHSEIDELIVKLSPITTGAGIPLWGSDASFDVTAWTRVGVTPLPGGTTVLHYRRGDSS